MQQVTPRQQKRIQREAGIISVTMNLLKDRSFMELRMSEVAKAAECSMGAIYSHFSSKEDLLLACSTHIVKKRDDKLSVLTQGIENPLDKIILCCFMFWYEDNQKPQEYELCHLSWNPSIWQRASAQRNDELNKAGNCRGEMLTACGRRALEENLDIPVTDDLVDELIMSLGGLSIGMFHFKESSLGVSDVFISTLRSTELHIDCLARVLRGWELNLNNPKEYLWNLYNLSVERLKSTQD